MSALTNLIASVLISAKRLWNHRLLMLCLLLGLVVAVGLLSSIPLYSDAVHHRLLQGELTDMGAYRPPFAFLWRYIGTWHGAISWEKYGPIDQYLSQYAVDLVGLPLELDVRHVRTDNLRLFPAGDTNFERDKPLMWTSIGFISNLADHIEITEGESLSESTSSGDKNLNVLVSQTTAELLGLQVNEEYLLFDSRDEHVQMPVRVVGVWKPRDAEDSFWFYQPTAFDETFLVSERAFQERVAPQLDEPVALAIWYQIFDGSRVRTSIVSELIDHIVGIEARVTALLNNTTLDASPVDALYAYQRSAHQVTLLLTIFGIPVIGLVLYFIGLIASMVVRRGQAEIAVLRSRGTSRLQVLGVYFLEGIIVGGFGLLGGLVLGRWLAQVMARTRTFLGVGGVAASTENGVLEIVFSSTVVYYGLLGIGLALVALLLPSLVASRHTIVSYKWERARALARPIWQRFFLDFFLLIPALYGWYLLQRQGTILSATGGALDPSGDPFDNPLLFLVPVFFCFSLSLVFARVFPVVMGALSWLSKWLPSVSLLMTMRQMARSTNQFTGPLLLLALTLSLATFTASMARTLDEHLVDQVYYQVGADLKLVEMGESTEQTESASADAETTSLNPTRDENEPRWLFLPVSEHLQVDGIRMASRVGRFSATSNIGGRQQSGQLLGLDRADFPEVAFFRSDFATGESLGGLMNRLAVDWPNILVSRNFMSRNQLQVGDPLQLTVGSSNEYTEINFIVAGPLDLFPTLYPQDGPFFVANLEYIHEGMGGTFPYDVWLSTSNQVPTEELVGDVRDRGISVVNMSDARETILAEQMRPERQGLFGLLSVGFMAAAALTVLGFLVFAIVSFRQRFIELGMLRAIGLSVWQMVVYLASEQALLILTGAGLGTGLGVWASSLFIPFLQVGTGKFDQVPPFVVQIAWEQILTIYIVFGAMFVVAVGVLIVLLVRMKIFEAVKLGETV